MFLTKNWVFPMPVMERQHNCCALILISMMMLIVCTTASASQCNHMRDCYCPTNEILLCPGSSILTVEHLATALRPKHVWTLDVRGRILRRNFIVDVDNVFVNLERLIMLDCPCTEDLIRQLNNVYSFKIDHNCFSSTTTVLPTTTDIQPTPVTESTTNEMPRTTEIPVTESTTSDMLTTTIFNPTSHPVSTTTNPTTINPILSTQSQETTPLFPRSTDVPPSPKASTTSSSFSTTTRSHESTSNVPIASTTPHYHTDTTTSPFIATTQSTTPKVYVLTTTKSAQDPVTFQPTEFPPESDSTNPLLIFVTSASGAIVVYISFRAIRLMKKLILKIIRKYRRRRNPDLESIESNQSNDTTETNTNSNGSGGVNIVRSGNFIGLMESLYRSISDLNLNFRARADGTSDIELGTLNRRLPPPRRELYEHSSTDFATAAVIEKPVNSPEIEPYYGSNDSTFSNVEHEYVNVSNTSVQTYLCPKCNFEHLIGQVCPTLRFYLCDTCGEEHSLDQLCPRLATKSLTQYSEEENNDVNDLTENDIQQTDPLSNNILVTPRELNVINNSFSSSPNNKVYKKDKIEKVMNDRLTNQNTNEENGEKERDQTNPTFPPTDLVSLKSTANSDTEKKYVYAKTILPSQPEDLYMNPSGLETPPPLPVRPPTQTPIEVSKESASQSADKEFKTPSTSATDKVTPVSQDAGQRAEFIPDGLSLPAPVDPPGPRRPRLPLSTNQTGPMTTARERMSREQTKQSMGENNKNGAPRMRTRSANERIKTEKARAADLIKEEKKKKAIALEDKKKKDKRTQSSDSRKPSKK